MDGLLRLIREAQEAELLYNPKLRDWMRPQPNAKEAGKDDIERAGSAEKIIWQNRSAAPTPAEDALGDALEEVLEDGADTLQEIADGLNARDMVAPDGSAWSEGSLAAELHRLGA